MEATENGTKKCPYCGESIKAEAIKCRFCGEMLEDAASAGKAAESIKTQARRDRNASDVLYRGGPSLVSLVGSFFWNGLFIAVLVIIAMFPLRLLGRLGSQPIALLFDQYRGLAATALCAVILLSVLFDVLKIKTTRYSVTMDRLEFERGVLSKRTDNLDLFRIQDLKLRRSLLDRVFGVGTVRLVTTDDSHPIIEFYKIKDSRKVYDTLKRASLEADKRRRVIHYE